MSACGPERTFGCLSARDGVAPPVSPRGGTAGQAWQPALVCLLYFAGTVFHVKTMIRERDSRAYLWASRVYHAGALVAACFLSLWVTAFFTVCLLRTLVVPALGR